MATTEYLPVATGGGANVDSQAAFNGAGYQTNGFSAGIARSAQMNKIWRQASMVAAALTQTVADITGINIADDGVLATLITNLKKALRGGSNALVAVAFSATPTFDASLGNIFEITLTGNVTSSTLSNAVAGANYTFIIHQDGTGSRTFVPPASVPLATIDPGSNAVSVQKFITGAGPVLYPLGGLTGS